MSVYCDWVRFESLVSNFYLSVAARKTVLADPSLRYTRMLLGRYATNEQTHSVHTHSFSCSGYRFNVVLQALQGKRSAAKRVWSPGS